MEARQALRVALGVVAAIALAPATAHGQGSIALESRTAGVSVGGEGRTATSQIPDSDRIDFENAPSDPLAAFNSTRAAANSGVYNDEGSYSFQVGGSHQSQVTHEAGELRVSMTGGTSATLSATGSVGANSNHYGTFIDVTFVVPEGEPAPYEIAGEISASASFAAGATQQQCGGTGGDSETAVYILDGRAVAAVRLRVSRQHGAQRVGDQADLA